MHFNHSKIYIIYGPPFAKKWLPNFFYFVYVFFMLRRSHDNFWSGAVFLFSSLKFLERPRSKMSGTVTKNDLEKIDWEYKPDDVIGYGVIRYKVWGICNLNLNRLSG